MLFFLASSFKLETQNTCSAPLSHITSPWLAGLLDWVDGFSTQKAILDMNDLELTILMPCLNEAETLATCIGKAKAFLQRANISGEILISDNGSTDGSQKMAEISGARVVNVTARGYGAALIAGITAAKGRYIIMGDSDDSYDFSALDSYISALRQGYELVMGNRFKGGIAPGAMPPLHRYLGNPVLSGIGRLFFRSPIRDFHCGLRGFNRESIISLGLKTPGMEFASEMVVKATLRGLKITEVPTTLQPDGRSRAPHLRSWRDGWRHLRFLLLFSPTWLFLYPGLFLLIVGLASQLLLFLTHVKIGPVSLGVHSILFSGAAAIVGLQMCFFAVFGKVFAKHQGLIPSSSRFEWLLSRFTMERGLVVGLVLFSVGLVLAFLSVELWAVQDFGPLEPEKMMRLAIPSAGLMIAGSEFMLGSFFLGLLQLGADMSAGSANTEERK